MDKSIEAAARAMYRYHNLREVSNDAWRLYESEARTAIAAYRDAEIERLTAENDKLLGVLEQHGFRRCDIAACNCGSWHHIGGFAARFREIEEATEDYWENGEVLLARIERIVAKLEAAERDAERYRWLRENRLWLKANLPMLAAQEFDAGIDSAMRDYYAARGGERG